MMTRPRFDPTVSLGNLLSVVSFVGALAAGWMSMDSRVSTVEAKVATMADGIKATEARSRESDAELRVAVRRIDDKITALLIQGYRGSSGNSPTPLRPE